MTNGEDTNGQWNLVLLEDKYSEHFGHSFDSWPILDKLDVSTRMQLLQQAIDTNILLPSYMYGVPGKISDDPEYVRGKYIWHAAIKRHLDHFGAPAATPNIHSYLQLAVMVDEAIAKNKPIERGYNPDDYESIKTKGLYG